MSVKIIYLNGPSSCGKTTLVKALQDHFDEPYLHIGIDKLIGFMPEKLNDFYGTTEKEGYFWKSATDPQGEKTYQICSGPFAKKIEATYKDLVVFLANQGYNLIIDDVAFGKPGVGSWKQALSNYKVLYVGVRAPLEIIETREKERGDRMVGCGRGQYYLVHENVEYDLEIDTHQLTIREITDRIDDALKRLK